MSGLGLRPQGDGTEASCRAWTQATWPSLHGQPRDSLRGRSLLLGGSLGLRGFLILREWVL